MKYRVKDERGVSRYAFRLALNKEGSQALAWRVSKFERVSEFVGILK